MERSDVAESANHTRVMEENRRIALNDPRRFFDARGSLKPVTEWTEEMAAVVSKVEVRKKGGGAGDRTSDTVVRLWFWNKSSALEVLCKHLGLLQPEAADSGPPGPMFIMPPGTKIAIK